jgi:hypothetical protein
MNSQPRDILYLIISFLVYTPDTAALGRTCKTLDRIPQWYERSGHCSPHNWYKVSEKEYCYFYQDGRIKHDTRLIEGTSTYSLCRSGVPIYSCLSQLGAFIGTDSGASSLRMRGSVPVSFEEYIGFKVITVNYNHADEIEVLVREPEEGEMIASYLFGAYTRKIHSWCLYSQGPHHVVWRIPRKDGSGVDVVLRGRIVHGIFHKQQRK